MGTNYYWRHDGTAPESLKRLDKIHIGKSSAGWAFTFHATKDIRSWKDWKEILKSGGKIVDEYSREISYTEFVRKIHVHKNLRHSMDHCYLDTQSFNFRKGYFS